MLAPCLCWVNECPNMPQHAPQVGLVPRIVHGVKSGILIDVSNPSKHYDVENELVASLLLNELDAPAPLKELDAQDCRLSWLPHYYC